jgi:hypothetical protein
LQLAALTLESEQTVCAQLAPDLFDDLTTDISWD